MLSLKRKQDLERQQEQQKQHQKKQEWKMEKQRLQGEINVQKQCTKHSYGVRIHPVTTLYHHLQLCIKNTTEVQKQQQRNEHRSAQ